MELSNVLSEQLSVGFFFFLKKGKKSPCLAFIDSMFFSRVSFQQITLQLN